MLVEYFSNLAKVGICKFKPCKTQTEYGGKLTSTCIIVKLLRTEGKEKTLKVARQEAWWVLGAFTSPAMSFKEGGGGFPSSDNRNPDNGGSVLSGTCLVIHISCLVFKLESHVRTPASPFTMWTP